MRLQVVCQVRASYCATASQAATPSARLVGRPGQAAQRAGLHRDCTRLWQSAWQLAQSIGTVHVLSFELLQWVVLSAELLHWIAHTLGVATFHALCTLLF